MKRRNFLKNAAIIGAGTAVAPYIMKGDKLFEVISNDKILNVADDNILIIIEMFGGNDGLNTILPYHQEAEYIKQRPLINIPMKEAKRFGTSDLYMHPALVTDVHNGGLMRIMENGRLGVIQGVGYDNPNLSHFRSQEIWLSGINSSDPNVKLLEGWLGRYFASRLPQFPQTIPEHPLALQVGNNISLLVKSSKGHMGIAVSDPNTFYTRGLGLTPKDPMYDNPANAFQKEYNFAHLMGRQSEMYAKAVKEAYDKGKDKIKVKYSDGLAQKFQLISALIAGGLKTKVYNVNISNFDFHAQQAQPDMTGQHWSMLSQVASAISEFLDDAAQIGYADRIVGTTISEFGRRAYDNASRGTDHGAASMQFVFGGSDQYVKGGYYAEKGKPDMLDLDDNGNLKHQYDFRRTYSDILQNWMGATQDEITALFGAYYFPHGVIKPRTSSVEQSIVANPEGYIEVLPNPNYGTSRIKFELRRDAQVDVTVYNAIGLREQNVKSDYLNAGIYEFPISINTSGTYYCSIRVNGLQFYKKFEVLK